MSIIYSSYSVYHYCDDSEFENHCNPDSDSREKLIDKIKMVAGSNALAALFTTIVIIAINYLSNQIEGLNSVIPVSISLEVLASLAIMATVFNTSLRIAAFGMPLRKNENIGEKQADRVRNKIISFGFSFWMTLYYLIVIGLGVAIFTGDPSIVIPQIEESSVNIIIVFGIAIFVTPALGAILSEISLLYLFDIPDACKECR